MSFLSRSALLIMVVVALAGCGKRSSVAVLTTDGQDKYTITENGTSAVVTAKAGNTSNNLREIFWSNPTSMLNAQSCATWTSDIPASDTGQQGAALRITSSHGDTRAITVTKNIFGPKPWQFNVHTWDSRSYPAYVEIARFEFSAAFHMNGIVAPLPWHICAKVVGSTLSFIVWPDSQPVPAWGDPSHGGSVQVPPGWDVPGKAGWFAGHLKPGAQMRFGALSTAAAS